MAKVEIDITKGDVIGLNDKRFRIIDVERQPMGDDWYIESVTLQGAINTREVGSEELRELIQTSGNFALIKEDYINSVADAFDRISSAMSPLEDESSLENGEEQ